MKKKELWKIYDRNSDLIKFSDTKSGIIVTLYGVIGTIVYSNSHNVYNALKGDVLIIIFSIIIFILSVISFFYAFLSINPSLKNNKKSNNIYFNTIANNFKSYHNYKDAISKYNFKEDLIEQVYTTSLIARKKFYRTTYAIRFFSASIIIMIINICYYLLK